MSGAASAALNRIAQVQMVNGEDGRVTTEMPMVATTSDHDNDEEDGALNSVIGALAALLLLTICIGANVFLILSMKRRPIPSSSSSSSSSNCHRITSCHGTNNNNNNSNCDNVKRLISLIAGLGLLNGSCICIMQIMAILIGDEIFNDTYCKLHGMASNLMSLLIIWYEALLGFERYVKFVKPQDYQITFSKINLQIIQLGILFVLLSAVSGPIYGWGNYTYLTDIHLCHFDLGAANAVSYFVLSTVSYVLIPYAIMAYCCSALLLDMLHRYGTDDTFASAPWNSMERRCVIIPLAVTVVSSFVLQLPTYVFGFEETLNPSILINPTFLFVASWLQTFAVNCCFACIMLTFCACRRCLLLRTARTEKSRISFRHSSSSSSVIKNRESLDVPPLEARSNGNRLEKLCSCWLVSLAQQPRQIKLSRLPKR